MQYFGTIETKYDEIFLTESYMYFNEDDEIDGGLCTGSAINAVTFFINPDYITNTKKA